MWEPQSQLVIGDVLDELVHSLRLLIEVHQGFLDAQEVMDLLEDAGGYGGGGVHLVPVDGGGGRLIGRPHLIREVGAGRLGGLSPAGDVLDHPVLIVVDGELAGGVGGPGQCDAPGVHAGLADLQRRNLAGDGIAAHHLQKLVLVYKAVGVSAPDGLKKILSFGKHFCLLLV